MGDLKTPKGHFKINWPLWFGWMSCSNRDFCPRICDNEFSTLTIILFAFTLSITLCFNRSVCQKNVILDFCKIDSSYWFNSLWLSDLFGSKEPHSFEQLAVDSTLLITFFWTNSDCWDKIFWLEYVSLLLYFPIHCIASESNGFSDVHRNGDEIFDCIWHWKETALEWWTWLACKPQWYVLSTFFTFWGWKWHCMRPL